MWKVQDLYKVMFLACECTYTQCSYVSVLRDSCRNFLASRGAGACRKGCLLLASGIGSTTRARASCETGEPVAQAVGGLGRSFGHSAWHFMLDQPILLPGQRLGSSRSSNASHRCCMRSEAYVFQVQAVQSEGASDQGSHVFHSSSSARTLS